MGCHFSGPSSRRDQPACRRRVVKLAVLARSARGGGCVAGLLRRQADRTNRPARHQPGTKLAGARSRYRQTVANNIASVRTTLDGVTDVPSAQAALPKLQQVAAQIDKTDSAVGQLSAEQRKAIAAVINPLMPAVNQLCDKVLAIPGVAEVLQPSVDTLKAKLTALTA